MFLAMIMIAVRALSISSRLRPSEGAPMSWPRSLWGSEHRLGSRCMPRPQSTRMRARPRHRTTERGRLQLFTTKEIVVPSPPQQQPVHPTAERDDQHVRSTPSHKRRVSFPFEELYVDLGGSE